MTITRIMQFANCRHRFFLSEILGLHPKVTTPALHTGTLAHVGKDVYYTSLKERKSLDEAAVATGKAIATASQEYEEKAVEMLSDDRREEARLAAREQAQLAAHIVGHFLEEHYEADKERFASLDGIENELKVHIGKRVLRGHVDAVWKDKDGRQIVSEWKTMGDKTPNVEWVNLSWQNVIYSRGVEEMYGTRPTVEYCFLRKKIPAVPKVTKSGAVSKAACDTTVAIFRRTLKACGQTEEGYEEILAKLEHNRFNWIVQVHRNEQEIAAALDEIGRVMAQLTGAKRVGESAFYRNTEACRIFSCPYRSICMERNPEVVKMNYTTPEERKAVEAEANMGF